MCPQKRKESLRALEHPKEAVIGIQTAEFGRENQLQHMHGNHFAPMHTRGVCAALGGGFVPSDAAPPWGFTVGMRSAGGEGDSLRGAA